MARGGLSHIEAAPVGVQGRNPKRQDATPGGRGQRLNAGWRIGVDQQRQDIGGPDMYAACRILPWNVDALQHPHELRRIIALPPR
jgi:hypothetical protein